MPGGIFLIQGNGELVEMTEHAYDSEDILQELLVKYPSLLAGDQMDSSAPRNWLLIKREASIPSDLAGSGRWSIDHVFLDQDAIPTLIEVKRSTDTRIRREVVGQMLYYAANAMVYWPIESVRAQFETTCELQGRTSEDVLTQFLIGTKMDSESFWQTAKINLQRGKVRLVFVADDIPPELKRIVEFLNQQMDPAEVLAVEIRQYKGQGLKTLVPRVMGQTEEARIKKGTSSNNKWTEETFFQKLKQKRNDEEVRVARKILEWTRRKIGEPWWGKGERSGSFVPIWEHNGNRHQLFAIYTYGSLEIYFQYYQNKPVFNSRDKRQALLDRLNSFLMVKLPSDAIEKRPNIPLSDLKNEAILQKLFETFEWFMDEVKASSIPAGASEA